MTKYIFESPDGGKTVIKREFGKPLTWEERNTISQGVDRILEERLWRDILLAAKTNQTLRDELNRVIVTYDLIRKDY